VTEHAPYQGYAFPPPPGHVGPARPVRTRAWIAMVALGLIAGEALVVALLRLSLYPSAADGEPNELESAVATFVYRLEPLLSTLLLLVAGVAFIVWLHRARTNLDSRDAWELNWKRGWTIGGWFLPLAHFVIPPLVVSEIDEVSERRAYEAEGRQVERHRGIVVAWIVLWSSMLLDSQFGARVLAVVEPGPSALLAAASEVLTAAAAASAILVVRRITTNQERVWNVPPVFLQPPAADPGQALRPAAPTFPG
jgi:hypothetical protein